jgi:DNA repair exonuclease SbcCD ATPase subunit
MAKKIKGITIEIGGDVQPLNKAMEGANKKARDLQSELRQVERLLKLDPKNIELLAQKQKLLSDAVSTTKEKLDTLREAEKQVQEQFKRGEVSEEQYRALQREIITAEQDLKKFEKQLQETGLTAEQAAKKLQDVGKKMTDMGKDLSVKVTAPIVAAGAVSYKMAADLQDAMGATEQIYKEAADAVKEWADSLPSYYGIAEAEALEYANMMGTMLVNIGGLTREEAAKQAQALIELAGDLTAMYGGTTADAVRALTGALKGNNTMLDNYGMAANDAMIKTKALEMGLINESEQLTLAAKQAATLALIMEQSGAAQGQAAREAEGASGSMRSFATEVKNLSTDIGEMLLPVITPIIGNLRDLIQRFSELDPRGQKVILIIAGLAATIGPLLIVLGMMANGVGSVITLFGTLMGLLPKLGAAFTTMTGPIGLVIAAVAALIAIGVTLYRNWDEVKYRGLQAWGTLKVFVLEQIQSILRGIEKLTSWIPKIGDAVSQALEDIDEQILSEKSVMAARELENRMEKAARAANELADELDNAAAPAKGLSKELENLANEAGDTGNAMGGAAKDTRAAWERTADILSNRLQILRAEYEIAALAAEENSNKVEQLQLKLAHLGQQMEVQQRIVAAVKQGYDQMVAAKGADAEESQKLQLRLLQERQVQAELEKQIRETTKALRDQAEEFRDMAVEIDKIRKKYRDDMAAALEDYRHKMADVNSKLVEDERRLTEQYESELQRRTQALLDWTSLFDQVAKRDVSGEQLLENLRGQVEAFEDWEKDITELAERGINKGLLEELRQMGPKAGPEIAALLSLTDDQLAEYVELWRQKNEQARKEATAQLQQQKLEMQQELAEIRAAAKEQLELYRQEWKQKSEEIRRNAETELKQIQKKLEETAVLSYQLGMQVIMNYAQGMEVKFDRLRRAVEEARAIVARLDPTMRHSPSLVDKVQAGVAEILAAYQGLARKMQTIDFAPLTIPEPVPALAGGSARQASTVVGGSLTIINQGTIVGRGGMEEFVDMIDKKLARKYGMSTGGAY